MSKKDITIFFPEWKKVHEEVRIISKENRGIYSNLWSFLVNWVYRLEECKELNTQTIFSKLKKAENETARKSVHYKEVNGHEIQKAIRIMERHWYKKIEFKQNFSIDIYNNIKWN